MNGRKRGFSLHRVAAAALTAVLLCLSAQPALAAREAAYTDGQVAMLTEPADGVLPLAYYRGQTPQAAAQLTWETGRHGQAVRLDGENDTLRMDGTLLAEKADLSLSLWFRQAEVAAQPLLFIGGREPATQLLQLTVGGEAGPAVQVQYGTATRAVEAENGRPLTEGWHHLALVWQDRTLTLYVDGALYAENTDIIRPTRFAPQQLCLGGSLQGEDTPLFRGLLDDVVLYDHALSAEAVAAMAQQPADEPTTTTTAPAAPADTTSATDGLTDDSVPDPLAAEDRAWLLLIPAAALVVIACTAVPYRRRR